MARPLLTITLALLVQSCATTDFRPMFSWSNNEPVASHTVDQWLDQELSPYLVEELGQHPRFKGEPMTFVSMSDEKLRTDIDDFSREIRYRLTQALLDTPGIKLVRQPSQRNQACPAGEQAHYHLVLQVTALDARNFVVSMRAYDVEEGVWVSGFGKSWQGLVSRQRRQAFERRRNDPHLQGMRDYPFTENQADLLARQLAGNLSCRLFSFVGDALRIYPELGDDASPQVRKTISLVANYLGRAGVGTITDDPSDANITLYGQVFEIDGELHQFWVAVKPLRSNSDLPTVDSQAYINVKPNRHADSDGAQRNLPAPTLVRPWPPLVSDVKVVTPSASHLCRSLNPWRKGFRTLGKHESVHEGECFALELGVQRGTQVFLVNHTLDAHLVQLLPTHCDDNMYSNIATGNTLRFPSAKYGSTRVLDWEGEPGLETFYVIAVADHKASRRVQKHLGLLANACEDSDSQGPAFDEWFDGLSEMMTSLQGRADWQAVQIRHAY